MTWPSRATTNPRCCDPNNGGVRLWSRARVPVSVARQSRSDAVAAALARSERSPPTVPDGAEASVRIALHTGEAQVRSE